MYAIYVIDKKGNKFRLLDFHKQIDLDRFTSNFDSPKALLNSLGLDDNYKISNEKIRKNENNEFVGFLPSKYRKITETFYTNELFDSVDKYDTFDVYSYFLEELVNFDDNLTPFMNDKRRLALNIIDNVEKETIITNSTKALLKNYLNDFYSRYKSFFVRMNPNGFDTRSISDVEKEYEIYKLNLLKSKIKNALSLDMLTFIPNLCENKPVKEKNEKDFEHIDEVADSLKSDVVDFDEKMNIVDQYYGDEPLPVRDVVIKKYIS